MRFAMGDAHDEVVPGQVRQTGWIDGWTCFILPLLLFFFYKEEEEC